MPFWDTFLSIQQAGCEGVEIACNEDACGPEEGPWQSRIKTWVLEGEQYLVRVSGWGRENGPFDLDVSCVPELRPELRGSEDRCEDAVLLDVPSATTGTTTDAGFDASGESSVLGYPRRGMCGRDNREEVPKGIWYEVVGTGNGMTVRVPETHRVVVYCDTCDHLICVEGGGRRDAG